MVSRKRLHGFFTGLGLYVVAMLLIGYFAINAYTGKYGLRAQQDLDEEHARLSRELDQLKRERASWERRVELLKSDGLDPDMTDERARSILNYADPRDLISIRPHP